MECAKHLFALDQSDAISANSFGELFVERALLRAVNEEQLLRLIVRYDEQVPRFVRGLLDGCPFDWQPGPCDENDQILILANPIPLNMRAGPSFESRRIKLGRLVNDGADLRLEHIQSKD